MWRFLRQAPHGHPRNENSSMGDIHWNTLSSAFVLFQFNYFSKGFEGLALLWQFFFFFPLKNHIKERLRRSCPFRGTRRLGFPLEKPQQRPRAGGSRVPQRRQRARRGSARLLLPFCASGPRLQPAGALPGTAPTRGKSSPAAPPRAAPAALTPVPPGLARIHVEALAHVLDEVGRLLPVRKLLVGLHAAAPRGRVLQLLAAEEPARRGRGAAAAPRCRPRGARARRRHDTSSSCSCGASSRRLHRASRESSRARARLPPLSLAAGRPRAGRGHVGCRGWGRGHGGRGLRVGRGRSCGVMGLRGLEGTSVASRPPVSPAPPL